MLMFPMISMLPTQFLPVIDCLRVELFKNLYWNPCNASWIRVSCFALSAIHIAAFARRRAFSKSSPTDIYLEQSKPHYFLPRTHHKLASAKGTSHKVNG